MHQQVELRFFTFSHPHNHVTSYLSTSHLINIPCPQLHIFSTLHWLKFIFTEPHTCPTPDSLNLIYLMRIKIPSHWTSHVFNLTFSLTSLKTSFSQHHIAQMLWPLLKFEFTGPHILSTSHSFNLTFIQVYFHLHCTLLSKRVLALDEKVSSVAWQRQMHIGIEAKATCVKEIKWLAAPFWSSHKNAYGNIHSWHMNWTCIATDMTWSLSMPKRVKLPRHAFVLHIHAMFHGVKCCSPRLSQIPLDHDWFSKLSIQKGFQLSLHGKGLWIACPSILSKKLLYTALQDFSSLIYIGVHHSMGFSDLTFDLCHR